MIVDVEAVAAVHEQLRQFGKVHPYDGDMQDKAPLSFASDRYHAEEEMGFIFGPTGSFGLPVTKGRIRIPKAEGKVFVHERAVGEVGLPAMSEFDTLEAALVYIRLKSTTWR